MERLQSSIQDGGLNIKNFPPIGPKWTDRLNVRLLGGRDQSQLEVSHREICSSKAGPEISKMSRWVDEEPRSIARRAKAVDNHAASPALVAEVWRIEAQLIPTP